MPCDNTNNDSMYNKDDFILVKSGRGCYGCYFDNIGDCHPSYFPRCGEDQIYVKKDNQCNCPVAMPVLGSKEGAIVEESTEFKEPEEPKLHQTDLHDPVNKPKHYVLIPEKGIEVRDLMKVLADQLDEKYYHGMLVSDYVQMMQYLLRWHRKNGLEDLEKAQWYLSKIIEQVKGTN